RAAHRIRSAARASAPRHPGWRRDVRRSCQPWPGFHRAARAQRRETRGQEMPSDRMETGCDRVCSCSEFHTNNPSTTPSTVPVNTSMTEYGSGRRAGTGPCGRTRDRSRSTTSACRDAARLTFHMSTVTSAVKHAHTANSNDWTPAICATPTVSAEKAALCMLGAPSVSTNRRKFIRFSSSRKERTLTAWADNPAVKPSRTGREMKKSATSILAAALDNVPDEHLQRRRGRLWQSHERRLHVPACARAGRVDADHRRQREFVSVYILAR